MPGAARGCGSCAGPRTGTRCCRRCRPCPAGPTMSSCATVFGGGPVCTAFVRRAQPPVRHVALAPRRRERARRRREHLRQVRVDQRLVAVHVQLLGVRVEDDVLVEVRERHLVVDAVRAQSDRRVEPVAQCSRRRVVDRVVDGAPGLAVDLGARLARRRRSARTARRRPAARRSAARSATTAAPSRTRGGSSSRSRGCAGPWRSRGLPCGSSV